MFTAALFTTAKTRKQSQCPPADEWIQTWYIHTVERYSATKNEIMPFVAASVNKYHIIWNLKYDTSQHIYKPKQISRCREQGCGSQERGGVAEAKTGSLGLANANYYT